MYFNIGIMKNILVIFVKMNVILFGLKLLNSKKL